MINNNDSFSNDLGFNYFSFKDINKDWLPSDKEINISMSFFNCGKCGYTEDNVNINISKDQTPFEYYCKKCNGFLFVACNDEEQNKKYMSENTKKFLHPLLNEV
jgi:hypothetical protein